MHLIPSRMPEPRLLSSAARDLPKSGQTGDDGKGRSRLRGESLFSGNGWAIFVGIAVGVVLLCGAGALFERYHGLKKEEIHVPKVLPVATNRLFSGPHSANTPKPVVVQVEKDNIRVTAIVLGHPRLAVINGRAVTEGDPVVVHTPTKSVALTLRVVKISDGEIELSDGTQSIVARLSIPTPVPLKTASK